ncbi:cytochrome P450 83B1-like [Arachis ipaensis]|uniref:cytochrome P450 83B1-like n=1 Tax=Arachis ipaensis TaxID=130454 RepID=UPI0007AF054C|nr:cytochrome P450 83B1-like [Arachis ipaensis]XP_025634031.1 cytochrome P450 83B1 [Arachis hypogaea]
MVPPLIFLLFLTLPLSLFFFFFQKQRTLVNKNKAFPPGPRGLPIIGNLHQLNNSSLYLQLFELSKKYGPIFSLQLGLRPVIVISSPKLAKEALKNHDREFAGRPNLIAQQKLSYNGLEMFFSQNNDYWREIRKLCVSHLLSAKRVSSFSSIREFEVRQLIKKISSHASSEKVTNLNEVLMALTSTIICRIAFGRRYEDEGVERSKFHSLFNEFQAMLITLFVSDYIPFLGWIDRLKGLHARLDRIFKELDEFCQEVIDEHMNPNKDISEGEDIIDVLLQLKKQHSFSFDLTYDHIKAVLSDIIVAATDTTAATAVWAMTALIKNPRVMKKVQEEIKNFGGQKYFLKEEDIQKCIYFKAVMKETLRLYLPGPLLMPKETTEKCTIDGYEIPAKTIVYINAWTIHRDSEAWENPEEFYPERFLGSSIDFKGQDFELIPFGAGRRICPGMHMALVALDLILANLLYSFDWELPEGVNNEDVDVEALPGLAQHKKNPLYLIAKTKKE